MTHLPARRAPGCKNRAPNGLTKQAAALNWAVRQADMRIVSGRTHETVRRARQLSYSTPAETKHRRPHGHFRARPRSITREDSGMSWLDIYLAVMAVALAVLVFVKLRN